MKKFWKITLGGTGLALAGVAAAVGVVSCSNNDVNYSNEIAAYNKFFNQTAYGDFTAVNTNVKISADADNGGAIGGWQFAAALDVNLSKLSTVSDIVYKFYQVPDSEIKQNLMSDLLNVKNLEKYTLLSTVTNKTMFAYGVSIQDSTLTQSNYVYWYVLNVSYSVSGVITSFNIPYSYIIDVYNDSGNALNPGVVLIPWIWYGTYNLTGSNTYSYDDGIDDGNEIDNPSESDSDDGVADDGIAGDGAGGGDVVIWPLIKNNA